MNLEQVNVHDAKTHLSEILVRVEAGAEVTIARAGRPVARLVPVRVRGGTPRRLGSMRGKIHLSDDFDAPLPRSVLDAFEGKR